MIKAILFDFNGVIIDDEPIQLLAYQEVLRPNGITLTEESYYACLGMNDKFFVTEAFERAGKELTDEILESVIARKTAAHGRMIEKELPLFPGAITFAKAASRQYSIGLVSMARRVEIDHVLERANIRSLFDVIVSMEDVDTCKPDPACYVLGLGKTNETLGGKGTAEISPADCLVVEDAPPGIVAGRRAGMRTLGLTNTVAADELRAAGADAVTKSLSDWTVGAVHHVFDG